MEKQVDEFFRKKLEEHTLAPSTLAWDKIEVTLPKKNKIIIVWRVAAGLALMGCLLWVGLNWQINKPTALSGIKLDVVKPSERAIAKVNSTKEEKELNKITFNASKKVRQSNSTTVQAVSINDKIIDKMEIKPAEKIEAEAETIARVEPVAEMPKPIVLEYRLEPVETLAIAEAEGKKGFKGFLNAAKEIKNGEDGLGLQTLKDNILAFNFRKEKGKSEEEKNY